MPIGISDGLIDGKFFVFMMTKQIDVALVMRFPISVGAEENDFFRLEALGDAGGAERRIAARGMFGEA